MPCPRRVCTASPSRHRTSPCRPRWAGFNPEPNPNPNPHPHPSPNPNSNPNPKQAALGRLQRSGRLLCLASKNDEADVLEVFDLRGAEMGISREQLTAWEVHWANPNPNPNPNPKPQP